MQITWHGNSCFKIQETRQKEEVTVVTDPFEPEGGLKLPRNLTADVVLSSADHPRHRFLEGVGGTPFVITGPGEFEVKDVFVTGVAAGKGTLFFITVGDLHLLHLGDLTHPLEEKHIADLHDIDVLFVPVGAETLGGKQAAELVQQLEPRVIIPMHRKPAELDVFLKAMGASRPEPLPKYKIVAKDLPQEESQIVLLEAQ